MNHENIVVDSNNPPVMPALTPNHGKESSGASSTIKAGSITPKSLRGLDWLNFFLADVQTGVGPFVAIYLAGLRWNEEMVGLALTVGGIAGIATQTPAGALADKVVHKRLLVGSAVVIMALGALLIALIPNFWPVMMGQALIGGVGSIFIPAICAISLGIVGHQAFDARQGRNQTFNAAGNVVAALAMGVIGYYLSDRGIFFFVVLLSIPTILCLRLIDPKEIDHERARGTSKNGDSASPARFRDLLRDRPLVILLICSVMFHFANAAMLPLLGEMLGKGKGRSSMMFMSLCIITTQVVMMLLSSWAGRRATTWGRKRMLLVGFCALPVRGVLYTLTQNVPSLVAIQLLDGVGAGIFGVVSVLMIADLTQGTGRFNLTLGAITTAVGIGASLSQFIAGSVVKHFGYNAGFLFLSAIAGVAAVILWLYMPETKPCTKPDNAKDQTAPEPGQLA